MHNPFHDDLTPSTGLKARMDRALRTHSARKRALARAALEPPASARDRKWARLGIAGAVAIIPVITLVALLIVSDGGPSIGVFGGGGSNVPPGTGHSAPLLDSTAVVSTPTAAVATDVAVVPTPTIIIEPDTGVETPDTCSPVNAAGTPVANSQCSPTPTPTPSSHSRPAPRHASER